MTEANCVVVQWTWLTMPPSNKQTTHRYQQTYQMSPSPWATDEAKGNADRTPHFARPLCLFVTPTTTRGTRQQEVLWEWYSWQPKRETRSLQLSWWYLGAAELRRSDKSCGELLNVGELSVTRVGRRRWRKPGRSNMEQAGYSGWEKAFIYWDVSKAQFKTPYLLM